MLAVFAVDYGLMLGADPILRVIGKPGAAILLRVMGIILVALSVELILEALGIEKWLIPPLGPIWGSRIRYYPPIFKYFNADELIEGTGCR